MTSDAEHLRQARESVDEAGEAMKRAAYHLQDVENRKIGSFAYVERILAAHYAALLEAMKGRIAVLKAIAEGDDSADLDDNHGYN